MKNFLKKKKFRRMDQRAEKDKTERVTGLGRRSRDSKVESNDSPEIPQRGETSDIPGLPSGVDIKRQVDRQSERQTN